MPENLTRFAAPPTPAKIAKVPGPSRRILFSSNVAWNLVNYRGGLIQQLLADGNTVIAIAPEDRHAATLAAWGCTFLPLQMEAAGISPRADLALMAQFSALFRAHRPDIVFSFTIKNNIWGAFAARRARIPFVPNVSGLGSAFQKAGWLRSVVTWLYRIAFRKVPVVFFQNADDEALFKDLRIVRAVQARRLPGSGVDLERFEATPLPGSGDEVTFLLIARMLWEKGIGEFVEAARLVRQRYPAARFQLLGFLDVDNPSAITAAQMAAWHDEGAISYLGTSDDVRTQIAVADCVVLPTSYGEGTPRTLLEACAMGRPIITTMVPGCREVLREGENGFACAPKATESLVSAMMRMIELGAEGRARLAAGARQIAETDYSEQRVIAAYYETLSQHADAPRAP
jgi:glycosyltransferase involved in cell wall biosynthesis